MTSEPEARPTDAEDASEPDPPFRFHHEVDVRFKDVDVGGHAHHSHALVYFEEARAAYWRDVVGRGGIDEIDYILAEARIRYHGRVLWPQRLRVGARVVRLRGKLFEMAYEVRGGNGDDLLVSGSTRQIMYDYEAGRSVAIPDDVRRAIEDLDGPFDRRGGSASIRSSEGNR